LPVALLVNLGCFHTSQARLVAPQFLAANFKMLRDGQPKAKEG